MSILDLPDELLGSICIECIPDSLIDLAVSCKRLYNAAEPWVRQHFANQKFWTSLYIVESAGPVTENDRLVRRLGLQHVNVYHPLEALAAVVDEPLRIRYIRNVFLNLYIYDDDLAGVKQYGRALYRRLPHVSLMSTESSFSTRKHIPYLTATGESLQQWHQWLSEGVLRYPSIVLLANLTHLQSIRLGQRWQDSLLDSDSDHDIGLVNRVLEIMLNGHEPTDLLPALPHLTTLLPSIFDGYDFHASKTALTPFLFAPSMRTWAGSSFKLEDYDECWPWQAGYKDRESCVEHMSLSKSVIVKQVLPTVLASFPRLKSLTLNHTTRHHGVGYEFNAGRLLDTLSLSDCAASLESLSLTFFHWYGNYNAMSPDPAVFTAFKSLRQLEIHVRCFLGPSFNAQLDSDQEPWRQYTVQELESDTDDSIRLGDILPGSLQSLALLASRCEISGRSNQNPNPFPALAARLMRGFGEQARSNLPFMRQMTLLCSAYNDPPKGKPGTRASPPISGNVPLPAQDRNIIDAIKAIAGEVQHAGVDFVHQEQFDVKEHLQTFSKYYSVEDGSARIFLDELES